MVFGRTVEPSSSLYKDQALRVASLSLIPKANRRAEIGSGEQLGNKRLTTKMPSETKSLLKPKELVSAEGIEPSTY